MQRIIYWIRVKRPLVKEGSLFYQTPSEMPIPHSFRQTLVLFCLVKSSVNKLMLPSGGPSGKYTK